MIDGIERSAKQQKAEKDIQRVFDAVRLLGNLDNSPSLDSLLDTYVGHRVIARLVQ